MSSHVSVEEQARLQTRLAEQLAMNKGKPLESVSLMNKWRFLKKQTGLFPFFAIMGGATVWVTYFFIRQQATNPDYRWWSLGENSNELVAVNKMTKFQSPITNFTKLRWPDERPDMAPWYYQHSDKFPRTAAFLKKQGGQRSPPLEKKSE